MRGRSRTRPPLQSQRQVMGSPLPSPACSRNSSPASHRGQFYRTTSLETRSRSPSPNPTPTSTPQHEYYGSSNLTDRSRSPSPQTPRRQMRRLPQPSPVKPSSLNLSHAPPPDIMRDRFDPPGASLPRVVPSPTITPSRSPSDMNFPRLQGSPTRNIPKLDAPPSHRQSHSPSSNARYYTEKNNLNRHANLPRNVQDSPRTYDSSDYEQERYDRPQTRGRTLTNGQRDRMNITRDQRDYSDHDRDFDDEEISDFEFAQHGMPYNTDYDRDRHRGPTGSRSSSNIYGSPNIGRQTDSNIARSSSHIQMGSRVPSNISSRGGGTGRGPPPSYSHLSHGANHPPVPNGYKPGQGVLPASDICRSTQPIRSDSEDDDDWC